MHPAISRALIVCGVLAAGGGALPADEPAMIARPPLLVEADAAPVAAPEFDPAQTMPLFEAIADDDFERFRQAINAGADPNAVLPHPAPPDFARRFSEGPLFYYVNKEPGFSALMLAAALGREKLVRFLLAAGANRNQTTKRHRTFALYLAAKNEQIEVMRLLMGIDPQSDAARFRIEVDLAAQRATVWNGASLVAMAPISSGKSSTPTRRGTYLVTNKYRRWKSTIFHVSMPYFLRLSCGDFGLHAGYLPGYPASHGCIRLPEAKAKQLFASVPVGALVTIR